jgi:hypothetical protein
MSEDRLEATVFMGWLAVVFIWFAATVLRGRGERFVAGVLVSGWGTLIALNIANPAAYVARTNIARATRGFELDVSYLQSLGADAAPALTSYLVKQPLTAPVDWSVPTPPDRSNPQPMRRDEFSARCFAARHLLEKWAPESKRDWRGWTLGKSRARTAVAANEQALRTLAGMSPASTHTQCVRPT